MQHIFLCCCFEDKHGGSFDSGKTYQGCALNCNWGLSSAKECYLCGLLYYAFLTLCTFLESCLNFFDQLHILEGGVMQYCQECCHKKILMPTGNQWLQYQKTKNVYWVTIHLQFLKLLQMCCSFAHLAMISSISGSSSSEFLCIWEQIPGSAGFTPIHLCLTKAWMVFSREFSNKWPVIISLCACLICLVYVSWCPSWLCSSHDESFQSEFFKMSEMSVRSSGLLSLLTMNRSLKGGTPSSQRNELIEARARRILQIPSRSLRRFQQWESRVVWPLGQCVMF